MQARRLWENTTSEEALGELFAPCLQRVEHDDTQSSSPTHSRLRIPSSRLHQYARLSTVQCLV